MTSELGVTEHIEGDECKFAVWTGRAPTSDTRVVLRANSMDAKQLWVMRLREVIQETFLGKNMPKSPAKKSSSQRSSRDLEECASLDESVENLDRNSLASFGSTNTTDSDKVRYNLFIIIFFIKIYFYMIYKICKLIESELKRNCTIKYRSMSFFNNYILIIILLYIQ